MYRKHGKNLQDGTVVVLDKDNFQNYVELPSHIMEKFKKGIITITHLSDILRFKLLYQYGGIWIDSTIYISQPIPSNLFDLPFYTIRQNDITETNISKFKWTAFLIGGKKGNILFEKMCALFDAYWLENDNLPCYFLIDYFLYMIYTNTQFGHEQIDCVSIYEGDVHELNRLLCTSDINKLDDVPVFSKLSWKANYPSYTADGKETIFLKLFGQNGTAVKKPNLKKTKLNSLLERLKKEFCIKRVKQYGVRFCGVSFLLSCLRSNQSKFKKRLNKKYHEMILLRLENYKKYL